MLYLTCATMLSVVLLWSAASKLTRNGSAAALEMLGQLGVDRHRAVLAWALVVAEAGVALALWPARTRQFGAVAALLLFATLTMGVGWILRRRMNVRCACFGASTTRLGRLHLARNLGLLGCAAIAAATVTSAAPTLDDLVLSLGVGGMLALAVIRLEDLVFLIRPTAGELS